MVFILYNYDNCEFIFLKVVWEYDFYTLYALTLIWPYGPALGPEPLTKEQWMSQVM